MGTGRSPRVRGNLHRRVDLLFLVGSIPACTGEPRVLNLYGDAVARLSPRVRGNPACVYPLASVTGVYPRVYGGTAPYWAWKTHGSIPACTGEPGNLFFGFTPSVSAGLSPRVRGNHRLASSPVGHRQGVYPRVYGGTLIAISLTPGIVPSRGLSPRVRGNPGLGKRSTWRKVYPRVYGGTAPLGIFSARRDREGLSPRVRGNQ